MVNYPLALATLCYVLFAFVRLQVVPADRKRTELFLATAGLSMPMAMISVSIVKWMGTLPLPKLDLYIFRIDGLLGFQPSFALGQIVQPHLWMVATLLCAYRALVPVAVLVCAFYIWHCTANETSALLRTFVLNFFLAPAFYFLVPVCGPAYAFPDFPFNVPHGIMPHTVSILAPPNGVPSVHMSTALLIVWFSLALDGGARSEHRVSDHDRDRYAVERRALPL